MYLVNLSFFIQKSRSFKSPKINIIDIIVDVLLLMIIGSMRYFKIIILERF